MPTYKAECRACGRIVTLYRTQTCQKCYGDLKKTANDPIQRLAREGKEVLRRMRPW